MIYIDGEMPQERVSRNKTRQNHNLSSRKIRVQTKNGSFKVKYSEKKNGKFQVEIIGNKEMDECELNNFLCKYNLKNEQ